MNIDLLEVLKILGPTAGSLVFVIYLLLKRYSHLVDTAIEETRRANELRVEDAQKRAAQQDEMLRLLANLLTVVGQTIGDVRSAAEALHQTITVTERMHLRRVQDERHRSDRGISASDRPNVAGGLDP